jgi:hypothetical protein
MPNKDESRGYTIFGVSLGLGMLIIFVSLALAMSNFGTNILTLLIVYPIAIVTIAVLSGFYGKRNSKSERLGKKSRLAAMLMAWAPGKGHEYLGYPQQGKKFIVPLAIGVVITAISVPFQDGDLVFYGCVFMLFSVVWSCVDTNRICDELKLPYSESMLGRELEIHFKRSDILEILLFYIMWLLLIGVGHGILTDVMNEPLPDKAYIQFFDIVGLAFPVIITIKYVSIYIVRARSDQNSGK